ncbi:MAG TPA: glycosyltransferase family 87 protein [Candidatus Limnocylindria bacterium]|nr:glycosyltransferase family 87 protein [Candidatus Limnocylindria bacterium]
MAAGDWLRDRWAVVAWAIVGILAAAGGIAFLLAQQTLFTPGGWFGLDGLRLLDAAATWQRGGDPYTIPGYLYAPAATIMAVPFAALGGPAAIVAWLALEVGLVAIATRWSTSPAPWWAAAAALPCVLLFQPVIADLLLANVTVALTFGMLLVVRGDRPINGLLLGVLGAAFPKPLLAPFVLWALVWRRQAFVGIVAGAAGTTLTALLIAGPGAYAAFASLLASGGGVGPAFVGNTSLTLVSVPLAIAVGILVGMGFLVVLLRRDQLTSLVWATIAGIFLAPYAGGYAGLPFLAGLPSFWAAAPVLAIFAAVTMIIGGQLYPVSGAVVLAVALLIRPRRSPADTEPIRSGWRIGSQSG